jgi:hypothetical protein
MMKARQMDAAVRISPPSVEEEISHQQFNREKQAQE